jgi:hypothetical protein
LDQPQTQPPQQETQQRPQTLAAVATLAAGLALSEYGAAQRDLLLTSARLVRHALHHPEAWPALLGDLRAAARATAARLAARAPALAAQITDTAGQHGAAYGQRHAAPHVQAPAWVTVPDHQPNAVAMVARDLTDSLRAAAQRITRFPDDAYRAAVAAAASRQVFGELEPKAAQEQAWRDLMGQGVTGFTDRAGRQWNLATYTEMAVRTAAARAYRDSAMDRMTQLGTVFFTVSGTGRPCFLCAPWEGKVLASMGAGTFQQDGHTVTVDATVEEATGAGLFHPNCKHTLVAYTPGTTVLRPTVWTAQAEAAYQATQRLRALERAVRAAKAQHETALTPAAAADANRRARAAQAAIRDHITRHGLLRRRNREQPNLGFTQP